MKLRQIWIELREIMGYKKFFENQYTGKYILYSNNWNYGYRYYNKGTRYDYG